MIQAIMNNFGAQPFMIKYYGSADLVVLQGRIDLDLDNEEFKMTNRLEIRFDTAFPFGESLVSSCFLVHSYNGIDYGTVLHCQLASANALYIDMIPDFKYSDNARIYLASGFVAKGGSKELLSELPGVAVSTIAKTSGYNASQERQYAHFEDRWGYFACTYSYFYVPRDTEALYELKGFPTDVDIEVPLFCTRRSSSYADGSYAAVLHILSDGIHISYDYGSGSEYGSDSVLAFFFVRE